MPVKTTRTTSKASSSATRKGTKGKPSSRSSSRASSQKTKSSSRSSQSTLSRASSKKTKSTSRSTGRGRKQTNRPSRILILFTAVIGVLLLFAFWRLFIRPELMRPSYGTEAYHVRIPDGYTVHGIDISHHQGTIDWEALASLQQADIPIRFVFIKATEGADHEDKRFAENFAAAKEQGFIRGAYHFYNPATDPIAQANFFISHVTLEKGDLPPVIDIEKAPSRLQQRLFYAELASFLYRLEAHYGVRPIVYTFYKFKERYLMDSELDRYPLWIAHYHVPQPGYQGEWTFWQHTDRAVLPGIDEKTDLNVFNGSLKQLQSLAIR